MAVDIVFPGSEYLGSNPLYFVAYSLTTDQWVNASTIATETYSAANWSHYALALTLNSVDGNYEASFPNVSADSFYVKIYEQLGSHPATSDNDLSEGDFEWRPASSSIFSQQLQADAAAYFNGNEFAELVTYLSYGGTSTPMYAIIDRSELPTTIHESESKTLANLLKVYIQNDGTNGITAWTRKDQLSLPIMYGATPTTVPITAVLNSDPGMFELRLR